MELPKDQTETMRKLLFKGWDWFKHPDKEAQDAIEGRTRFIRPSVKRSKGE